MIVQKMRNDRYFVQFLDDGSLVRVKKSQIMAHRIVSGIFFFIFYIRANFNTEEQIRPKRFKAYEAGDVKGICNKN
jgi:hypothetical protein